MHQRGGSSTSGASGDLPGLARTYLQRRYTILFYTLLATMVAAPVFTALEFSPDRVIARRLPARGHIASWRGEKPPLSADGHRGWSG